MAIIIIAVENTKNTKKTERKGRIYGYKRECVHLTANNIDTMSTNDIKTAILLLENDIQVMKSTINQLQHQMTTQKTKIKENRDKIKLNKTLPWLVATVVEVNRFGVLHMHTCYFATSHSWHGNLGQHI